MSTQLSIAFVNMDYGDLISTSHIIRWVIDHPAPASDGLIMVAAGAHIREADVLLLWLELPINGNDLIAEFFRLQSGLQSLAL